jgi:endo-1,4-beta-mannosidase
MHAYPIYADWSAGSTDSELVPFLAEITRWLASGAPVLFEEFGMPPTPTTASNSGSIAEAAAAEYTGRVLDGLRAVGCRGALLWCFSDYDSDLSSAPPFDAAPHELSFGLWRADGTAKPAVSEITSRAGASCIPPGSPGDWLDIDAAMFAADRRHQLRRLYGRFRESIRRPA